MSEVNVEFVRRGFEEFQAGLERGDPAAWEESGVPVGLNVGQIWELDAGGWTRVTNHLRHAEALQAAGLSE
jgi:hypothetical protein